MIQEKDDEHLRPNPLRQIFSVGQTEDPLYIFIFSSLSFIASIFSFSTSYTTCRCITLFFFLTSSYRRTPSSVIVRFLTLRSSPCSDWMRPSSSRCLITLFAVGFSICRRLLTSARVVVPCFAISFRISHWELYRLYAVRMLFAL